MAINLRWYKYFKKEMKWAVIGTIMTASLVLIELTQPRLMSVMVDTGIVNKDFQLITTLGIRMVSLALFGVILGVGGIICAARAASGFAQELRKALLVKIQQFSLKEM